MVRISFGIIVSLMMAVLLVGTAMAQDLVVTKDGDSLFVIISGIKKNRLEWTEVVNGRSIVFEIAMKDVLTFKKHYGSRTTRSPESHVRQPDPSVGASPPITDSLRQALFPDDPLVLFIDGPPPRQSIPVPRLRMGVRGGYSMLLSLNTASYQGVQQAHMEKLRNGFHVGGDIAYFPGRHFGFGLTYNMYRVTAQTGGVYAYNLLTGQVGFGSLRDNATAHFIAPTFNSRVFSRNRRHTFGLDLALGYLNFRNNASFVEPMLMKTSAFGMALGIGADLYASRNITVGFGLTASHSLFTYYDITVRGIERRHKLEGSERENFSRLEFSLILRWRSSS